MAAALRFDDKTVIVTGAGGGLGKAYALFFASRGANVVINDLGVSHTGEGKGSKAADVVVDEIKAKGGKAVANYDSVEDGDKIVETALSAFGGIHIIINNAGILRDVSFKNMKENDWDLIFRVHVRGAYKVTHAAWPHFRKQKYGRVINTASAAGLYGNFGQTNYAAAKLALVGFTETLAKEGAKYNIISNVITPIAASRMTETVLPPDLLAALKPEFIVPVVAYLVHDSNTENNGQIFEAGAGFVSKVRWERAKGASFNPDLKTFTPSAVLKKWDQVQDFSEPAYPNAPSDLDYVGLIDIAKETPPSEQGETIDFKDKVVVVTGAGGGLGRVYALNFAKLGAKVVVNDVMDPDTVVKEIKAIGGQAVGDKHSVTDGEGVVKTALDAFGGIHVVIANAGILRDKSFAAMTDELWDQIYDVHVKGTYSVVKAAWPHFLNQKYGRVITTSSAAGLYGNFGQTNYSSAKMAILGFSKALAREGQKYNILVNCVCPNAGTKMLATVLPPELIELFKPDYIAPLVTLLGSDKCPTTLECFEVGSCWVGRVRWQRTGGVGFPINKPLLPEDIAREWAKITDFDNGNATNPDSPQESMSAIMENLSNEVEGNASSEGSAEATPADDGDIVAKAKAGKYDETEFTYTERDAMLYNLGIGSKRTDLKWVFEGADGFEVLPTFGVIPQFSSQSGIPFGDFLPNFNPMMLLHGEQFLEVKKYPIPTDATLVSEPKVIDIIDKGKAAIVVIGTVTKDKSSGEVIFENSSQIFLRGAGGFGGPAKGQDRGAATAVNTPPSRSPDNVVEEQTTEEQAAIYRLSGDYNPLHIDPDFASMGGFEKPILHGLCSFGISGKHVYQTYGQFKNIKVRFAGHVFPGETLQTEMWKEGNKVIFQTKVKERGKVAIAAAAVELFGDASSEAAASDDPEVESVEVQGFEISQQLQQGAQLIASVPLEERKKQIKQVNITVQLDVTNAAGQKQSWWIDGKDEGGIYKGKAKRPTVTLIAQDKDLVAMSTGKANGQKMFMQGKLKIKGNMTALMKLQKLRPAGGKMKL